MKPIPLLAPILAGSKARSRPDLSLTIDEKQELSELLCDLVRMPSTSGQEGPLASMLVDYCQRNRIPEARVDRVGNVTFQIGNGGGPVLLFDSHMDTVIPPTTGWRHPPYQAVIDNGILHGMGASDTKASLAALIFAARKLIKARVDLHGALHVVFVVQQEPCEGCALRAYIEDNGVKPDWVVLGEPSALNIMRGHRGRVLFKVIVHGKSSHASNPEIGQNAATIAARLIFGIELFASDLPVDPFLGPGTVAVTHVETQSASKNAIPHTCVLYIDRRLTLGETPTRAQSQLESIIQREDIDAEVSVVDYRSDTYTGENLSVKEAFSAWVLEETNPLIHAMSGAVRAATGRLPRVCEGTFSTDGVYSMGLAGIPTIGFGPGDPLHAHTSDERVNLEDVGVAAHVYALLAATLLGSGA